VAPNLTNYVYHKTIFPGANVIANQLANDSTVATLLPYAPFGTYLLRYNPGLGGYEPANTFTIGGWTRPDQPLLPGEGAWLVNPSARAFEVHISGTPIAAPAVPPAGANPSAPCGLVSFPGNRPATYSDILGPMNPPDETMVTRWDAATQTHGSVFTYLSELGWIDLSTAEPGEPVAAIGEPLLLYGAGCPLPMPAPPCALNIFRTPCRPCHVTLSWQCSRDDCPLQTLQWTDDLTSPANWRPVPGNPASPFTTNCCEGTKFFRLKCQEAPPAPW
jgi:hypothetical protein